MFAHAIWIETPTLGVSGKMQNVKIFYGEFSEKSYQKIDGPYFKNVKDFTLTVVSPTGKRMLLPVTPAGDHYQTTFTPSERGIYTIVLENTVRGVMDLSKIGAGRTGIIKPMYFATAVVTVGDDLSNGNDAAHHTNDFSISPGTNSALGVGKTSKFKVHFKQKDCARQHVEVLLPDGSNERLDADSEGMIEYTPKLAGKHVFDAIYEEKIPGAYNDQQYQMVKYYSTMSFDVQ